MKAPSNNETRRVLTLSDLDDLPCPWCNAPAAEADERCPGCGHRFG